MIYPGIFVCLNAVMSAVGGLKVGVASIKQGDLTFC